MISKKHKVLIIDNSTGVTGALKSVLSFVGALDESFSFSIVLSSPELVKELKNDRLYTYYIPFVELQKSWRVLLYFPFLIINTLKLRKIINDNQIDILHVNDLYNMCGVLLKLLHPNLKVVYHIRLLPSSYARSMYRIWLALIERYADMIICVSESVKKNVNKNKTTLIYDALDLESVEPSVDHIEQNELRILYIANYIPGKGHLQALESFKESLTKIPRSKLIFFGSTLNNVKNEKMKKTLVKKAFEWEISDLVEFNSFTEDVKKEIEQADLILNFSESESFSMTTLEALAYGAPIIATRSGGPEEIIVNNESGILVPVNELKQMTDAIINLSCNPELRNNFAKNGIQRAKAKFDLKNQATLLNELYVRLLN